MVTLTINGTVYTGVTNATGLAVIDVPEEAVGEDIAVNITKDDYDPISYTTTLGTDGIPATQPEAMDEAAPDDGDDDEPDDEGGLGDYTWIILIIVIVAVLAIVGFVMMGRGKAPAAEPDEAVPEEPATEDPESADAEEPAPEEGAGEPADGGSTPPLN